MTDPIEQHDRTDPVFPWNDAIGLSPHNESGSRAVVICLAAIFDLLEQIRDEARERCVWEHRAHGEGENDA